MDDADSANPFRRAPAREATDTTRSRHRRTGWHGATSNLEEPSRREHASTTSDSYVKLALETEDRDARESAEGRSDFAEQVLQSACAVAGFDWRESGMTMGEAIDLLPADLAEATLRVMQRTYTTAGDDEHASWTKTTLLEVQTRRLADQQLQTLPETTPRVESIADESESAAPNKFSAAFRDAWAARVADRLDATSTPDVDEARAEPSPQPQEPGVLSGWYEDPSRQHQHRYWDGATWADRVADNGVQADDPLRWAPPQPQSAESTDAKPARFLSRIRSLRKLWMISTVVFIVLTVGYLLLPVRESSTRIDGTQTVSLTCGSVISPQPTSTQGTALKNASSICDAARQPNESRAILFGILAGMSLLLAGYSTFVAGKFETQDS